MTTPDTIPLPLPHNALVLVADEHLSWTVRLDDLLEAMADLGWRRTYSTPMSVLITAPPEAYPGGAYQALIDATVCEHEQYDGDWTDADSAPATDATLRHRPDIDHEIWMLSWGQA